MQYMPIYKDIPPYNERGSAMSKPPTIDQIVAILKKNVDDKKFVDVSPGVEKLFDVEHRKFSTALKRLLKQNEGAYRISKRIKTQIGTDKKVALNILSKTDSTYRDIFEAIVKPIEKETNDN